jgi:hypothetical protein
MFPMLFERMDREGCKGWPVDGVDVGCSVAGLERQAGRDKDGVGAYEEGRLEAASAGLSG